MLKHDRVTDAEAAFQSATTIYQVAETPYFAARLSCGWGEFYHATGDAPRARQQWETALFLLDRLGEKQFFAPRARAGLAALG